MTDFQWRIPSSVVREEEDEEERGGRGEREREATIGVGGLGDFGTVAIVIPRRFTS